MCDRSGGLVWFACVELEGPGDEQEQVLFPLLDGGGVGGVLVQVVEGVAHHEHAELGLSSRFSTLRRQPVVDFGAPCHEVDLEIDASLQQSAPLRVDRRHPIGVLDRGAEQRSV